MEAILNSNKIRVLITGFDSFEMNGVAIEKNASGEAVKLVTMKRKIIEFDCNIDLYTEVIPVEYKCIDRHIPELWSKLQPHLSIHVGVSELAIGLTLETLANKAQYKFEDNCGEVPEAAENPVTGSDRLNTDLNVQLICEKFNKSLPEGALRAEVSHDAGLYVCEYIYYTSLALYQQVNKKKCALFVHVPVKTTLTDFMEISNNLEHLIKICVKHFRNNY